MPRQISVLLIGFLLISPISASAEGGKIIEPTLLAFADPAGPRGIKLSEGSDEEEEEPEAEESSGPIEFDEAITGVDSILEGASIKELIDGTPIFSPIEGLPEAVWKEKTCSSCHDWTQDRLCTQGQFYLKQGLEAVDRKQHPYGGAFKRAVMDWAEAGCE